MGRVNQRVVATVPGLVAVAVALALGAGWPWAAAALVLFGASWPSTGLAAVALLVAAPLALAAGSPLVTMLGLPAAIWLVVAAAAVAPLMLRLGGRLPWRATAALILLAPLGLVPFLFTPWAPSLFASDLTTRAQVVLLAAATLVLVPLLRMIGTEPTEPRA